jgi:hypothetical protein
MTVVEPRHAVLPGVEKFHGFQMHSHNYRVPHFIKDQVHHIHFLFTFSSDYLIE